jgi:hypothetical protein
MSYPETYKYAKSHEWLLLEGETATIGITDYAQSSLGDIVFVELPKVGAGDCGRRDVWVGRVGEGGERPVLAGRRHRDGDQRGAERCAGDDQHRGE